MFWSLFRLALIQCAAGLKGSVASREGYISLVTAYCNTCVQVFYPVKWQMLQIAYLYSQFPEFFTGTIPLELVISSFVFSLMGRT